MILVRQAVIARCDTSDGCLKLCFVIPRRQRGDKLEQACCCAEPVARRVALDTLVERFDIEPYSDFSAK